MEDCIFCKIANKEIKSEIVFEDEKVIAFNDITPQAPIHVLVIPKKHIPSFIDIAESGDFEYVKQALFAANKIAKEKGLDKSGFRIVCNHGSDAGQAVSHLHFHLLGGRKLSWPPG